MNTRPNLALLNSLSNEHYLVETPRGPDMPESALILLSLHF